MQGKNVLVVHHQQVHKENWAQDLAKHEIQAQSITYSTYAGIHKQADKKYDLVVWDEAHHITPRVLEFAKHINTDGNLFLSATVGTEKLKLLKQLCPELKMFKVSLGQAIKKEMLPAPSIFVKQLKLDAIKPNQTYVKGSPAYPVKKVHYHEWTKLRWSKEKVQYHIQCTQKQYYDLLTEEMEWYKSKYFNENKEMLIESDKIQDAPSRRYFIAEWYRKNEWVKNRWLQLGSQRKRYLGECKTEAVAEFLRNEAGRLLIFASSIEQCDKLAGKHVAVHSQNKKDNTDLVEQFNSKQIDRLYAVSMLTEGMNLTDLDKVYMVQLDGSKLQTVQKQGRSLRGTEPEIYIFLMLGTKEVDYFKTFLEELDESFCTYI